MALTEKSGLIIPEVWAAAVQARFSGRLVMRQFARELDNLQGNPGDTINFTKFAALSAAADLVEGTAMIPEALTQTDSGNATIKEVGKAVEITDSAQLTSLGDPREEAIRQLGILIARKVDADLVATAAAAPTGIKVASGTSGANMGFSALTAGLAEFGDEIADGGFSLIIHSKQYIDLLNDSSFRDISRFGAPEGFNVAGFIGMFGTVPVFLSDRMTVNVDGGGSGIDTYEALLVRGQPFGYIRKREPIVETDRDILARTTVVTTNVHYAAALVVPEDVCIIETQ